jgi:beta-glucuronidase
MRKITPGIGTTEMSDWDVYTLRRSPLVQELSGPWRFQMDPYDWGEEECWFAADFNRSDWAMVRVPQPWDLYEQALWAYEGAGWYATEIPTALVQGNQWQRLHFARVNRYAKVWLNGHLLGEHMGGHLPFELAATPYLRADGPNTLVVRVDNRPSLSCVPGAKVIEWMLYGGILKPVFLVTTGLAYISDLKIVAKPREGGAVISCEVEITNVTRETFYGEVAVHIQGARHSARSSSVVRCSANGVVVTVVSFDWPEVELWSPETPVLYEAQVRLEGKGIMLDEVSDRFGIRTVEVRGNQILLNGVPLRIQGVNRYDEYDGYGPTVPAEIVRQELLRIKQAGVNLIRTHYPQDPALLRMLDEIGLLMMTETSLCWWNVPWWGEVSHEHDEAVIADAEQTLTAMIRRDKNHPCIIAWSMANECGTDTEVGIAAMRRLLRTAKVLDSTRLVTFVAAGDARLHLAFDEADFVGVNIYWGIFTPDKPRRMAEFSAKVTEPTAAHLRALCEHFQMKPVVVTEFGGQGIYGMRGDAAFTEDYQAAYIMAVWRAIQSVPGVAGGVLWCWADYYHRRDFITYAPYGPYGVVTVDRKAKVSLMALIQMFGGGVGG